MTEPTKEELRRRIAELERQISSKKSSLTLKVSGKGAVSFYGLQRFPVTLYYDQWIRLLNASPSILAFLEDNKDRLCQRNEG